MTSLLLIDPSRYSPSYDAALADGFMRIGVDIEFASRQRRPEEPDTGHELPPGPRSYRWSEAVRRRLRRLAGVAKVAEHPIELIRLLAHVRTNDVDVVHAQWLVIPVLDGLFLKAVGRHATTAVTVHNSLPVHGAPTWSPQRFGMEWAQRQADVAICHTAFTRASLESQSAPPDPIVVIPHGLLRDVAARRQPRGVITPKAPLQVLAFGRLRPYKGIDTIVEAVGGLDPAHRANITVRVAGVVEMDLDSVKARADELGVADRFTWNTGFVSDDDMTAYFDDADVLALPYRDVDASGVLVDGQVNGLAIVASDLGGFSDLIDDDDNGLLVKPGSAADLAAAFARLIDDEDLVTRLQAASHRTATDMPDWTDIARLHLDAYELARHR